MERHVRGFFPSASHLASAARRWPSSGKSEDFASSFLSWSARLIVVEPERLHSSKIVLSSGTADRAPGFIKGPSDSTLPRPSKKTGRGVQAGANFSIGSKKCAAA